MGREAYRLFSEAWIGDLRLPNRLVRSGTWDPCILPRRRMKDEVVAHYRQVAEGGVGLIITGDFPVVPPGLLSADGPLPETTSYAGAEIEGLARLVEAVHGVATGCRLVAQIEAATSLVGPSDVRSPFLDRSVRPLSEAEIQVVVTCFAQAIARMQALGFAGVQLHAAHGALLSCFLSPYTNRRTDAYGGSVENRVRIVREIVSQARAVVGDYPILIKVNATDFVQGGLELDSFPEQARALEQAGCDAIEISGGMWDCLVRTEKELGFRPVPAPESHTQIARPERQSYFLPFAERLDLGVPVILVGGNRHVERLEEIVRRGSVDLISMCRPLICEPDLPRRWLEGRGSPDTECISCNACLHDLWIHPGREEPGVVRCVFKADREQYKAAQAWLSTWVERNRVVERPNTGGGRGGHVRR